MCFRMSCWCFFLSAMAGLPSSAQLFSVIPSSIAGLELVAPTTPAFDILVKQLVTDSVDLAALQPALRYSVVVRNSTSRTVGTLVVRFEFEINNSIQSGTLMQPYAQSEFGQGAMELFTPAGAFRSPSPQRASSFYRKISSRLEHIKQSPIIKASLDAVVFADGELVGPDVSETYLYRRGLSDLQRDILERVTSMRDLADASVLGGLRDLETLHQPSQDPALDLALKMQRRALTNSLINKLTRDGRDAFNGYVNYLIRQPRAPDVWKRP